MEYAGKSKPSVDILNFWLSISGVMLKSRTAKIGAMRVRSRPKSAFCTDCTGTYLILKLATNSPLMDANTAFLTLSCCGRCTPLRFMKALLPTSTSSPLTSAVRPPLSLQVNESTGMSAQLLRCMRSVNTGARQLPDETITLPA